MRIQVFFFAVVLTALTLSLLVLGYPQQIKAQPSTLTITAIPTIQPIMDEREIRMVYVPAGSFIMGQDVQEYLRLCSLLRPQVIKGSPDACQHGEEFVLAPFQAEIGAFYIDQYEVSRSDYKKCVQSDVCNPKPLKMWVSDSDDFPLRSVSYYEAAIYCAWRNTRLPTEEEWEYAARGPKGATFPWGNNFDDRNANFCDSGCADNFYPSQRWNDGFVNLAPVHSYENGKSWIGAYNLAGNVAEWTSTIDGYGSSSRVYKGGYFSGYAHHLASWVRFWNQADSGQDMLGFRCVRRAEKAH